MKSLTGINPAYPNDTLEEISNGRFQTLDYLKHSFSKFRDRPYRDTQIMALDFIVNSNKRFIVIEAPTGAGKSLTGMAASQLFEKTIYTVHSKTLQMQLKDDFPEAAVLFGRSNYTCAMVPKFTCAECPLIHPKSGCKVDCPYQEAKRLTMAAHFRVLNYAYLLTEMNYVGRFSKQSFLVIDEADSLETVLYNFVSIAISESTLESMGLAFPKNKVPGSESLVEELRDWALSVHQRVKKRAENIKRVMSTWTEITTDEEKRTAERLKSYNGLLAKLDLFVNNVDTTWQLEIKEGFRGGKSIHFKPLFLTPALTEHALWRHADRFLLLSATFPPMNVLSKLLGINQNDISYLTLPSNFPVENRRCILSPIANLTFKTQEKETPLVVEAVKKILAIHPGEKGLVHTVSYKIAQAIMSAIDDPRMITHDGKNKQEILNNFRASDQPLVLVSPSSERGLSLEDAQCRFIILCKSPFLSLGDKAVKARVNSGPIGQLWYSSDAALTICQSCGRGVRNETDHAISYLLDFQIYKLLTSQPTLLPEWFREAVEFIDPQDLLGMEENIGSALDNQK